MPELPEVETIARHLHGSLSGELLRGVRVLGPGCLATPRAELCRVAEGSRVKRVWRRAKLLLLETEEGGHLAFHLKMTGSLIVARHAESSLDKHTHLVFTLPGEWALFYRDVRKFGYCRAFASEAELAAWPFFTSLGPEPLQIGADAFASRFRGRRALIKPLLLDQKVVAGIGNIYADEALHLAGIHPATRANQLGEEAYRRLHATLIRVLQEAIAAGGSTFSDFVDSRGASGRFQESFRVYRRAGEPCLGCGQPLHRITVSGRGSVFCPRCQPPPE